MNIIEAIENRRSVKHYDPHHVMPETDVAELVRLTKLAPSSFNMQNYRLVLVRDPELRKEIRVVAWDQAQVTDASLLVVMCADQEAYRKDPARYWSHAPKAVQDVLVPAMIPFYDGKPRLARDEAIRSSALAGMTLMLAARALGYESCPMVGFDADAVAKLINLPKDHVISFMIAIG
jgi:nitroreductase